MRDKPCLTSADVEKALSACKAEAQKNKWNVSIAVLDEGGFLLDFHRMDGARMDDVVSRRRLAGNGGQDLLQALSGLGRRLALERPTHGGLT